MTTLKTIRGPRLFPLAPQQQRVSISSLRKDNDQDMPITLEQACEKLKEQLRRRDFVSKRRKKKAVA